jgi:uncharacterized membrane protein
MVSKASLREAIEILGIFSMFAMSVVVYLLWWLAFREGGQLRVRIDAFGEMWVEYVLWVVVTPIITLALYYYLKQENRTPRSDDPE